MRLVNFVWLNLIKFLIERDVKKEKDNYYDRFIWIGRVFSKRKFM